MTEEMTLVCDKCGNTFGFLQYDDAEDCQILRQLCQSCSHHIQATWENPKDKST